MTVSPASLTPSHSVVTIPRSGRLADSRLSRTLLYIVIVSPARTGLIQRISSMPGEPMLVEPCSTLRTSMPMNTEHVCQPLATSPPNIDAFAASEST